MADGFVVLQSYVDSINLLPEERRWPFFMELFRYRMDGTEPEPLTDLERMALVNIFPVIDRSVERYAISKENGAKGGRPRKWIPPEEWFAYYKEHGRKETAEHFDIPEETLKKWIQRVGKKGKNHDKDIDMDIDTDKDIDIHTSISNNKNNKAETPKTLKGVSAIRQDIRPCQPGFEFIAHGKRYRFNDAREVEELGPA